MHFFMRIARRRDEGGVDTTSASIEAGSVAEAVEVAVRATEAFLVGSTGVGVLTDATQDHVVWSWRLGMPAPDVLRGTVV